MAGGSIQESPGPESGCRSTDHEADEERDLLVEVPPSLQAPPPTLKLYTTERTGHTTEGTQRPHVRAGSGRPRLMFRLLP